MNLMVCKTVTTIEHYEVSVWEALEMSPDQVIKKDCEDEVAEILRNHSELKQQRAALTLLRPECADKYMEQYQTAVDALEERLLPLIWLDIEVEE